MKKVLGILKCAAMGAAVTAGMAAPIAPAISQVTDLGTCLAACRQSAKLTTDPETYLAQCTQVCLDKYNGGNQ